MLDWPGFMVIYGDLLSKTPGLLMLRVCERCIFQRQCNNNDDNLSNTSGLSNTAWVFLCYNYLRLTILTLVICMCDLLTFFWQTSSLSTSRLPVHQLALRAGGGHRGSPDRIPIITEGVPSAWIPGGGLPQPPLGLGLQTGFLDVVAGQWQPVAVDLVQVSATRHRPSVVFFCRCKVTQVRFLCGTTNKQNLRMHINVITGFVQQSTGLTIVWNRVKSKHKLNTRVCAAYEVLIH